MLRHEYELVERGDAPDETALSLCVTDDCMSPHIPAGARVYVAVGAPPEEFGAGVFMYKGRVLCRQWCEDYLGAVHLLVANPARQVENITVPAGEKDKLVCLGRVILDEGLPKPR